MKLERCNRVAPIGVLLSAALVLPSSAYAGDEDDVRVITKGGAHGAYVVTLDDDTRAQAHSVEVRMDDGEVVVRVDGEEIPDGQVIREDGRIIILDANGDEMKTINLAGPGGAHTFDFHFGDGENRFWVTGDESMPEPKVMLGIHLGAPGAALERHLRLEAGTSTLITGLYEGLPAHDAGLTEYDVIVAINGKKPADPGALRTVLAESEAGATVRLKVIHEGEPRNVTVRLESYDREAMTSAKLIGNAGVAGHFTARVVGPGGEMVPGLTWSNDFELEELDLSKLDHLFLDDKNRVFETLPRVERKRVDESETDEELDTRLRRLDQRLSALQDLLDELVTEAKKSSER
jgi:serine protease Do